MGLKFLRKNFKGGYMKVIDKIRTKDKNGKELIEEKPIFLLPQDNGKIIKFSDEKGILERYPQFFTEV